MPLAHGLSFRILPYSVLRQETNPSPGPECANLDLFRFDVVKPLLSFPQLVNPSLSAFGLVKTGSVRSSDRAKPVSSGRGVVKRPHTWSRSRKSFLPLFGVVKHVRRLLYICAKGDIE